MNPIPGINQHVDFPEQAFIAKLNASGSALVYASMLNGNGKGSAISDLQVDSSGNAWVAGYTLGTGLPQINPVILDPVPSTFPVASETNGSPFFAEVAPQGGALLRSTLFYGPGYTAMQGQAPAPWMKLVFPAGRLCLAGIGLSAQSIGALGGTNFYNGTTLKLRR